LAENATQERKARSVPVPLGEVDEIPARQRKGFWAQQFESTFKPNPGKKFGFGNVSPTTASNLRSKYGLDAVTRNTHENGDGKVVADLYVVWDPTRAEAIKREAADRKAKRAAAGNGATKAEAGK
jgi:hypothetical protein